MEELRTIPVTAVSPDPNQPRRNFDNEALQELADSIKQHGLIQPIAVTDLGDGRYRLIYGERRWRAHKLAGLDTIRAVVSDGADPADILTRQVIENEYQSPLNPIEQATVYHQLNTVGVGGKRWPLIEIAHRFGKAQATVTTYMRLLELDAPIQEMIAAGRWPVDRRATDALLSIPDADARLALVEKLTENGKTVNIPSLVQSVRVLLHKMEQAKGGTNGRLPAPQTEARAVAEVELPESGRMKGGRLQRWAADTCKDCAWRSDTGLEEPAWAVFLTAVDLTCQECSHKIGGGNLDVCRDCPLPTLLAKAAKEAVA